VLANPCVPKKPLDSLKYIPLFGNPDAYVSLGMVLRERLEINDAPLFGVGAQHDDTYLLQRLEVHADVRLGPHVQIFAQFEDAQPYGKDVVTPVDKNPLDLRQAFVAVTEPLGPGTVKVRVGRQEMAFDLQRFVSVRDGPNVRQAFDAIWADYETGPWRWIAYATQPVQYRDNADFDDVSNRDLTFSGFRMERKNVGPGDLSAYYSRYNRSNAKFLDASGNEHRDVFDTRYAGNVAHIDWDVEVRTRRQQDDWRMGGRFARRLHARHRAVDAASGHPDRRRFGRQPSGRRAHQYVQSAVSERLLLRARRLHRLHEPPARQANAHPQAEQQADAAGGRRSPMAADHGGRSVWPGVSGRAGNGRTWHAVDRLLYADSRGLCGERESRRSAGSGAFPGGSVAA
jgi:hypothetical protein